jgi:SAM-dependent methyltransferase
MTFEVPADAYARFMGAYSDPLGVQLADFAAVTAGDRALDVGCGPGPLTAQLVARLGAEHVAAIDPSATFVAAARRRFPVVDVRQGEAESLPFADGAFDAALAQLVVHFMTDPVAGLREMGRVVRPGGVVAACVWDLADGHGPFADFWAAAGGLDPERGHDVRPGGRRGELEELCAAAGLGHVESTALVVRRQFADFDDWWEPYTFGIGPIGAFVRRLSDSDRETVRRRAADRFPEGPFEVAATAWAVRARVHE